jgi:hypothetical protein
MMARIAPGGTLRHLTFMTHSQQLVRYLLYPRIFFTLILCVIALVLHVAFGLYVWFWT